MIKTRHLFCTLYTGLCLFSTGWVFADGGARLFKDGDRVCFIGDSITHGGTYHSLVYLYYLTRFPEREIRFFNAGISGDAAQKALVRFADDVSTNNPVVSTVMLGMNDVGRWLYSVENPELDDNPRKQELLHDYYNNMNSLLDRLDAIGSEVILITPSIYDQTADIPQANNMGVNDALGACAAYVEETASTRGDGLVDFYDAMSRINADVQRTDPSATIVGADRIHPLPDPGHFIMAYQFLKAQDAPRYVSEMVLNMQEQTVETTNNCSITDLTVTADSISFNVLGKALPFPQTESISQGIALVPFAQEMNQEVLSVTNLTEGSYSLSIDGVVVGSYSAVQLTEGVNLALNKNTPQYKQALRVMALNNERHTLQLKLRNFAYTRYNGLADFSGDFRSVVAVKAHLTEQLQKIEGKSWYNYTKNCYAEYIQLLPQIDEISAKLDRMHSQLYQANQPVPHHFVIEKTGFAITKKNGSEQNN